MYLHCARCQTSVSAAFLDASNPVCPYCGEPAAEPLSFFSSMPSRYRRGAGARPAASPGPFPLVARGKSAPMQPLHR